MKFLPRCEAPCKTETKQPFEEQKENPSRLQRYGDESLAFHLLEILYPVIIVPQEKKKSEKIKTESAFACCQRARPHATHMVCCTAQHLMEISGLKCRNWCTCVTAQHHAGTVNQVLERLQPLWLAASQHGEVCAVMVESITGDEISCLQGHYWPYCGPLIVATGHYLAIMERHLFSE